MKRKIILGIILSGCLMLLSACGNENEKKTAEFIKDNQEYLKKYEISSDNTIEHMGNSGTSASNAYDLGDMQGTISAKDYRDLMIEDGLGFWLDDGSDISDEELEQTYYDFTNGPVLHTGDELIFAMEKMENFFSDNGEFFWEICGSDDGKFYEIGDDEYMRFYSSGEVDTLTMSISEIEPKILDKVFSFEDLENIF